MDNTYIVIPNLVLEDKSLKPSEIILLSVITGLMGKYGFCWASNKYLAEKTRQTTRQIQYLISSLKKKKYLIVEVEFNNERKIWTPGTWAYRDKYLEIYGKEVVECSSRDEFNQRFDRYEDAFAPGTKTHSPNNTIDNIQRHKEGSAPPPPSRNPQIPKEQNPKVKQLDPMLTKGHVPTPGSPQMVAEVKEILSQPFKLGSQYVKIADRDKEWFYGFSPRVIIEAGTRINFKSKKGDKISSYTVMLFSECAKIRKEDKQK